LDRLTAAQIFFTIRDVTDQMYFVSNFCARRIYKPRYVVAHALVASFGDVPDAVIFEIQTNCRIIPAPKSAIVGPYTSGRVAREAFSGSSFGHIPFSYSGLFDR
jgi:hypothetical protein